MWKKILKFLLYVLIIGSISALVIGAFVLLELPIESAFITLAVIFGVFFTVLILRKIYIRIKARAQVKRLINEEKPEQQGSDLGMSSSDLLKELRRGWRSAISNLKKSNLRLQGDPVYVLPWYMVVGKPRSGKSTALKNAKLLLPDIDMPKQGDGSTLNLDWWLYEQAIVLDTAGRYAVPDDSHRDKKEWSTLLSMLSRHKQKEPINGIVLVVAADRLLNDSEDQLMEEGRQVRASINELMDKLEVKVPVYLMVTKCDLIDGFDQWSEYLPVEAKLQAMGYLHEGGSLNLDELIDSILSKVLDRIKELRLLMLDRGQSHSNDLLVLPSKIEQIRAGLHTFVGTALKSNPYQDTPTFRGLFFSSSKTELNAQGQSENRGLFLHEFFTRVLPADRGLLDGLPSALRLRRAITNYAVSVAGGVTLAALVVVSLLYTRDLTKLHTIYESYPSIELTAQKVEDPDRGLVIYKKDISEKLYALYTLRSLILDLKEAQSSWIIPWSASFFGTADVDDLISLYNETFKSEILDDIDGDIVERIADLQGRGTSRLAGGLIRRINLLAAEIGNKNQTHEVFLEEKPPISSDYLTTLNEVVSRDSAELFNELNISYLTWNASVLDLLEEQRFLQGAFVALIERNHGDYGWIVDWANQQGNDGVSLSDFWGGTVKLSSPPEIPAAFTQLGRAFILDFLQELVEANDEGSRLAAVRDDFETYYSRRYASAWLEFAERFDEGKMRFRDRKEWLAAIDNLSTKDNPYFKFMRRMESEMGALEVAGLYDGQDQFEFFVDVQDHAGMDTGEAKGDNKKATKAILKGVSKLGKVGKMIAKVGKKGLKAKKKMDKGGDEGPDLDSALDDAAVALKSYNDALADIAFNSESKTQSHTTISTLFTSPDNPGSGDGPMAVAYNAVRDMQRLIGKPRPATKLFWSLYQGSMSVAYDYMEQEANCHLQEQWETEVLAELAGVEKNKLGITLIGESGLLWGYIDGSAAPFLTKRFNKGYLPSIVDKKKIAWSEEFLQFINKASLGRSLVGNEFVVNINTLPTGVNIDAAISPYATFLDLHCADGVQTLSNYNYSDGKQFKWSLESCGDVALQIDLGHVSLRKEYPGPKGFSQFFADFRDGHRVFVASEFPNQESLLRKESVEAIDVNYEFFNHEPVLRVLNSVPLDPPKEIAQCWPKNRVVVEQDKFVAK